MFESPIFAISLTVIAFYFAQKISLKLGHPIANPTLIAAVLILMVLRVINLTPQKFVEGGNYITIFLGPATVALGVPLYKQWGKVVENWESILAGVTVGAITGAVSAVLIAKILGGSDEVALSLAAKSVTTPIAVEVSRIIGGIPPLTAAIVVFTGVLGAVVGPELLKFFGIKNPIAIGISIGTTAHGLGTSRAVVEGEVEGAMSGLSIGLAGVITALTVPIIIKFII